MDEKKVIKQTFPVLEMSCAACAARVDKTLNKQPGVRRASVNYAAATATVEYESDRCSPEALKAWVVKEVESNPLLKVIYYQSVDARTMQEVADWNDTDRIQGCIAVQAGDIRLIDNIRIR